MSTNARRELDLSTLVLRTGAHDPDHTFCVMEAVAYMAGEPWSDTPKCACPVIASLLRRRNDSCTDAERQELVQYIPRMLDTKSTRAVERRRALKCADWAIRVVLPIYCSATGRLDKARQFSTLAPITSVATARAAAAATYAAYAAYVAAAANAAADAAYAADAADAAYATYAAYDAADAAAYAADAAADARAAINISFHELMRELLEIV